MADYTSSWSKTTGQTIEVADFTTEFDALESAFNATTGHKHDGTAGEGAYIPLISDTDKHNYVQADTGNNRINIYVEVGGVAVEQIRIQDGAIVPVTDNDIDLGSGTAEFKDIHSKGTLYGTAGSFSGALGCDLLTCSSGVQTVFYPSTTNSIDLGTITNQWKDLYIDGVAYLDSVDIDAGTIDGTTIGGTTPAAGTFSSITVTGAYTPGTITGHLLPTTDNTYDLGSGTFEWRNLYIDGTANIDSLVADTADINGGTIDGTIIGGTTPAAGTFTTITTTGAFTSVGIDDNATAEALDLTNSMAVWGNNTDEAFYHRRTDEDGYMLIGGGATVSTGGNIRLFGDSHATFPGDIQFRNGTDVVGDWDESAGEWTFTGTTKLTVLTATPSGTTVFTDTRNEGVWITTDSVAVNKDSGAPFVALRQTDEGAFYALYEPDGAGSSNFRGSLGINSNTPVLLSSTGQVLTPNYYATNVFDPVIQGTTVPGSGTYTNNDGRWTRIGNVLYFTCTIIWTAHTGTGNMKLVLTGLPTGLESAIINIYPSSISATANASLIGLMQGVSGDVLIVEQAGGDTSSVSMDSAGEIRASGFYFTNG